MYLGGNPISWSSKKQQVVSKSSSGSELRSLAHTSAELIWLCSLLHELHLSLPTCLILWVDNQSAAAMTHNPIFHARFKHTEIDYHFLPEQLVAGTSLNVQNVPTLDQVVDALTKALSADCFLYLKDKLRVVTSPFRLRGYVEDTS